MENFWKSPAEYSATVDSIHPREQLLMVHGNSRLVFSMGTKYELRIIHNCVAWCYCNDLIKSAIDSASIP